LEVELPKNPRTKPRVRRLDPVGTSRRGDTDIPGFLQFSLHSNSLNLEELESHIETTKLISLICALKEKIHSRDPSQLIPIRNNELWFQGMPPPEAMGLAYIAL
jgi:hypothetical protein